MIDFHTHLLPGMDGSGPAVKTCLSLLRMEAEQGVDSVVLTPRFDRKKESPEAFFRRREIALRRLQWAIANLPEKEQQRLPRLIPAAEVVWEPHITQWPELEAFCIGNTHYLLLELPSFPWSQELMASLFDFMGSRGVTPILAHLDRYPDIQKRKRIQEILSLGLPVQVSADAFLHVFRRRRMLRLVRNQQVQIVTSGCHTQSGGVPNLGMAMAVIRSRLGCGAADQLEHGARQFCGLACD